MELWHWWQHTTTEKLDVQNQMVKVGNLRKLDETNEGEIKRDLICTEAKLCQLGLKTTINWGKQLLSRLFVSKKEMSLVPICFFTGDDKELSLWDKNDRFKNFLPWCDPTHTSTISIPQLTHFAWWNETVKCSGVTSAVNQRVVPTQLCTLSSYRLIHLWTTDTQDRINSTVRISF